MTKADFISQVAQTAGLTKKDATAATDAVISTITDVLAKGDSVSFIGFGTFSTAERAAREARVCIVRSVISLFPVLIFLFLVCSI